MIVSRRHRFVFVKTRKTAGSGLEAYLRQFLGEKDLATGMSEVEALNVAGTAFVRGRKSLGHVPLSHILNHCPDTQDYFKFTIERNPWDKCVSQWWFFKRRHKYKNVFEDYIKDASGLPVDWPKYAIDGKVGVDKVLRFENLYDGIPELGKLLNLPLTFDEFATYRLKLDQRPADDETAQYYDKDTSALVRDKFRNEIKEFGYASPC